VLARLIDDHPGFDPDAWVRRLPSMGLFGALVFAIIGQQISVTAATAIFARLTARFGGRVPDAAELAAVDQPALRVLGLSWRKAATPSTIGRSGISEDAEHEADGSVDLSCLYRVKAAGEVAQPAGVDGAHLIDEHAGPGSVHLDLWPEDRGLRARRSRRDDQRREQDPVTLDRDRVPGAALLMPGGVLVGAQPVKVTTH
jgi:hypothetical protein